MTETPTTPAMPPWLEDAWLARYLDRALSTDERDWFEAYMLDKVHLIERVEVDNGLRAAVHAVAPATGSDRVQLPSGGSRYGGWRRARVLALAASFVVGFGLASVMLGRASHRTPAANPGRVVYDTLRARMTEPQIEKGDPASPWTIVDVAVPSGAQIVSAQAVVASETITLPIPAVSSEGFATYLLPSDWQGRTKLRFGLRLHGNTEKTELELVF